MVLSQIFTRKIIADCPLHTADLFTQLPPLPRFVIEKMPESVATEAKSDGFEGDDFIGGDIAQIDIGSKKFYKPDLLGFLRGFPDDVFVGNLSQNLLN